VRRALVTGGAGFIGSNLIDRLLADGVEAVAYDNLRTGRERFLSPEAELIVGDILDGDTLVEALDGCDTVFHLAANADVRRGLAHPERDLHQNTIGTATVLEAMRRAGVTRLAFSSTGSVYGEPEVFPTPEDAPFPLQTSLYGASKLAGEGLIGAYCAGYGFTGVILRFVSILGERYTHGHLFDFYRALRADPTHLHVLGNGKQQKSYLYVQDCVNGILTALAAQRDGVGVYNLGTDETTIVDASVATIVEHLGIDPEITYAGGERGWVGDSPLIHLDCTKLRGLGWRPELTIREAVLRTLAWFDKNAYVFEPEEEAVA
jgi:UDP-glucose 4-epimerase